MDPERKRKKDPDKKKQVTMLPLLRDGGAGFSMILIGILITMIVVTFMMRQLTTMSVPSDENAGGWRDAEFDSAASRFQSHVVLVRTETFRARGVERVSLETSTGEQTRVWVNRSGWPEATQQGTNSNDDCMTLWQQLAEPGEIRRTMEARLIEQGGDRLCRYSYAGKPKFDYRMATGQVVHHAY